jgi:hypothetical protein
MKKENLIIRKKVKKIEKKFKKRYDSPIYK